MQHRGRPLPFPAEGLSHVCGAGALARRSRLPTAAARLRPAIVKRSMPKRLAIHRATVALAALIAAVAYGATPPRLTVPFDANWRFFKGDAQGAQDPDFDDPYWGILNLPNDWSIEGPFDQKNPAGGGGAFLPTGVGWYRKHFLLPGFHEGQRLFLEFDGIMGVSDV